MKEKEKERIINKNGPVIVIEDDEDDQDFLIEIFQKLNYQNEILFFSDGEEALDHISRTTVPPFLILSDINLPKLNGFALREELKTDSRLSNKCIPYLFFSTALNQKSVIDAYSQSVQGIFRKAKFAGGIGENDLGHYGVLEKMRGTERFQRLGRGVRRFGTSAKN